MHTVTHSQRDREEFIRTTLRVELQKLNKYNYYSRGYEHHAELRLNEGSHLYIPKRLTEM